MLSLILTHLSRYLSVFSVDNLPPVPSSYEGKVNCAEFWQDIDKEMLSRSFGKGTSITFNNVCL